MDKGELNMLHIKNQSPFEQHYDEKQYLSINVRINIFLLKMK